jgi:uncharacterized protein (TIGR02145 family)
MGRNLSIVVAILCFTVNAFAQTTSTPSTVTDIRDGQVYKTVQIGGKTWLAQNLNFISRNSWCYMNVEQNCKKYGRAYSWFAAMNGQNREKSQGICLNGWHVPSIDEWNLVLTQFKKSKDLFVGGVSGFNMQMAGCRFSNASFDFENKAATFWTSTSDSSNTEFATSIYGYSDQKSVPLKSYQSGKTYGLYLRCVKN